MEPNPEILTNAVAITNAAAAAATELVNTAVEKVTSFPKEVVISTLIPSALNHLGVALRDVPWLKNYLIPFILVVVGCVAFCMVSGWTQMNAVVGTCLAFLAMSTHRTIRSDVLRTTQGTT